MFISQELRKKSTAEFVLYMWQVEDIIRAYDCDAQRICDDYIPRFSLDVPEMEAEGKWYTDLTNMMLSEGLRHEGHLQISKNVLQELAELHAQLVESGKYPYYRQMYYKVLPYIVELRCKQETADGHQTKPAEGPMAELDLCFQALYGIMMLRLQKKPLNEATEQAAKDIATLLGQLSDYYLADRTEPLIF